MIKFSSKALLSVFLVFSFDLFAYDIDEKNRNLKVGETLFSENCATCHLGKSNNTAFNLNPRDLTKSLLSQEQMYLVVKKGAYHYGAPHDYMIAYENIYREEEIKDIVYYVHKELNKNYELANELYAQAEQLSPDADSEELFQEGRKIYLRRCIHCHGPSGSGDGTAVKASAGNLFPYNLGKTLLTYEQKFLFTKYGSQFWGTQRDDMPAWSNVYSDKQIHAVVRYLDVITKNSNKQ